MTVELETPFLFVVPLVEVRKWVKEREGEERRKAGRSSHAGKTLAGLPRETNGEGDVNAPIRLGSC